MSTEPRADSGVLRGRRRWPLVLGGAFCGVLLVLLVLGMIGPGLGDGKTVEVRGEQVAFAVTVPNRLSAIDDIRADPNGECPMVEYDFGRNNAHARLAILAVGTDCDHASPRDMIMNGHHGNYRTMEDVPDPIDVEQLTTGLGPAELFVQEYQEHTNFSRSYEEPVAIVTLDDPVDPQFPTLLLRSEAGELSRERFTEVVASLEKPDS